jgi:hypothetical protein
MPDTQSKPITQVVIHMYKMGTGDCFVLKFMSEQEVTFNMVIDCGCYTRKFDDIRPYVEELKRDVENQINVLVVSHEHNDHVLGFQAGEALFTDAELAVDRIWMGWPENDDDDTVKEWKQDYGQKKLALALAAKRLEDVVEGEDFKAQFAGFKDGDAMLSLRRDFVRVLKDFVDLHVTGEYKGGLKGMVVVKDQIADNNITYLNPGDILKEIPGLDGVRIFVLGPPELHAEVDTEPEEPEDAYEHNKELNDSDLFVHALNATAKSHFSSRLSPFDESFVMKGNHPDAYRDPANAWRRIDYDWLFSSGYFALRLNSMTNNLSLCLAIEFEDSGKVMLFPGDAEFGSWKSWHDVDWQEKGGIDIETKDLLNRVVLYKVAHHLSHNGTAKELGLQMMTSSDLCAMASLDYNVISSSWKSTMPSRMILKELLEKTKGRTIVMNEEGLYYDLSEEVLLSDKIAEFRQHMTPAEQAAFSDALDTDSSEFYAGYTLTL